MDKANLNNPTFESDKLDVSENIHKELDRLGYPRDPSVVDKITEKHLAERNLHILAYERELREDSAKEKEVMRSVAMRNKYDDAQIDRFIRSKNKEVDNEIREHRAYCERENELVRSQISHYKREHCDQVSEAESSSTQQVIQQEGSSTTQSPLDYVLEKQKTEMPDIFDSDGGGE